MNKNFSFVKESVDTITPRETLNILVYETAGDINKALHYATRYPKERNLYLAEAKKATAQAISMLRMFCEQNGWNFEELASFGEEDYLEKMQDLKKYGIQENLRK